MNQASIGKLENYSNAVFSQNQAVISESAGKLSIRELRDFQRELTIGRDNSTQLLAAIQAGRGQQYIQTLTHGFAGLLLVVSGGTSSIIAYAIGQAANMYANYTQRKAIEALQKDIENTNLVLNSINAELKIKQDKEKNKNSSCSFWKVAVAVALPVAMPLLYQYSSSYTLSQ